LKLVKNKKLKVKIVRIKRFCEENLNSSTKIKKKIIECYGRESV